MTEINVNWQELIETSSGLADTAHEIDAFLAKFGTSNIENKIKITIANIASYFKQKGIITSEISASTQ